MILTMRGVAHSPDSKFDSEPATLRVEAYAGRDIRIDVQDDKGIRFTGTLEFVPNTAPDGEPAPLMAPEVEVEMLAADLHQLADLVRADTVRQLGSGASADIIASGRELSRKLLKLAITASKNQRLLVGTRRAK